jgi:methylase of polypeptide subunit release factors
VIAVTVAQALDLAASRLRAAGVTEAALDAELLLRHVAGWDRASIFSRGGEDLSPGDEARYFDLVAAIENPLRTDSTF